METIRLNNDVFIPQVGLGTWQITNRDTLKSVILEGFKSGYRLIDTAAAYGNEISVAKAIEALGKVHRPELFISDKVWNTNRGFTETQEACKRSMKKLKTDYIDLYLIHWPASMKLHSDWQEINAETWRGMEQLYKDGFVRAIGVCNFKVHHLQELLKTANIIPAVNQIECHPGLNQKDIRQFCFEHEIMIEASSPLGNGQILHDERILSLGEKYNKSAAQICLRWELQNDIIVIPKTTKLDRIRENINIFDFELSKEEMQIINYIPYIGGLGIDSDEVTDFG